jgi:hypothetical protein
MGFFDDELFEGMVFVVVDVDVFIFFIDVDVCIGDMEGVLFMSWGKRRELMGLKVPLPLAENPMNDFWRKNRRMIFHLP